MKQIKKKMKNKCVWEWDDKQFGFVITCMKRKRFYDTYEAVPYGWIGDRIGDFCRWCGKKIEAKNYDSERWPG